MTTRGATIYHVCLGDDNHHYFGSLAAVFDSFTPSELGVSLSRLYAFGITRRKPYRNGKCIIYKDLIHRKKTNRGR